MKEHKASPFTLEVLQLTRNGEIVGKVIELKCGTCGQEKTKTVESLNPLAFQNALKELFEESRLHSSIHVAN
ncbi:hypothetical protein [Rothia mucilaginosa]|uniref:hypothetical protein n=1 Tax=Rothia mucilaginosa TaxID=43675 RepID=UPI0034D402DA